MRVLTTSINRQHTVGNMNRVGVRHKNRNTQSTRVQLKQKGQKKERKGEVLTNWSKRAVGGTTGDGTGECESCIEGNPCGGNGCLLFLCLCMCLVCCRHFVLISIGFFEKEGRKGEREKRSGEKEWRESGEGWASLRRTG